MLARNHLIRIQRNMYTRLKEHARGTLGGLGSDLKRYFSEYQRDLKDFQDISSKRELLAELQRSHIIYCGDYHTLAQAQRTVIRLLRESVATLRKEGRVLVLALEMIRSQDDRIVNKYLKGELSESEFLRLISFQRNWGFSWNNYRELFRFAKEYRVKVIGINFSRKNHPTLKERDRFAAKIISELTHNQPLTTLFTLVGDLHLAPSHLPGEVKKNLRIRGISRKTLVIHQNIERYFWKLVDRGLEHCVDVLRVRKGTYCVMNTPPWIKLQSHLRWVELTGYGQNQGELSSTSSLAPRATVYQYGEALQEIDLSDEVHELIQIVKRFLGIRAKTPENFHIHGPNDLGFLDWLRTGGHFSVHEIKLIRAYINEFESCFIAKKNIIVLNTLSINHAASLATLLLYSKSSGLSRVFLDPKEDFYLYIWVEAFAFLGSKILNPRRKCNGPGDLERFSHRSKNANPLVRENARVARLALEHLALERNGGASALLRFSLPGKQANEGTIIRFYKLAKVLGHLLGQAIYQAVIEEKVTRSELRRLFETPLQKSSADSIRKLYLLWSDKVDRFGYRQIAKTERL